MIVKYINSIGQVIDFLSDKIAIQNVEDLFEDDWEYTSINSINFGGKVKKFYKGLKERAFTLSIVAESEREFDAIMKQLHDIFTYDVRTKQAGRLYINDSYLECVVFSSKYVEYEDCFWITDKDYRLVTGRPAWITEKSKVVDSTLPMSNSVADYAITELAVVNTGKSEATTGITSVISNDLNLPMPVKITIKGYCEAPRVEIGDNIYDIDIVVAENGMLVIDGLNRKVTLFDADGTESNVFGYRDATYDIFAEVPPGAHEVTYNGTSEVSITLFEERGEPSWM